MLFDATQNGLLWQYLMPHKLTAVSIFVASRRLTAVFNTRCHRNGLCMALNQLMGRYRRCDHPLLSPPSPLSTCSPAGSQLSGGRHPRQPCLSLASPLSLLARRRSIRQRVRHRHFSRALPSPPLFTPHPCSPRLSAHSR